MTDETERRLADLCARLDAIDAKLDQVLAFRDQLIALAAGSKLGKVLLGKVMS